jgi:hypothetical protein
MIREVLPLTATEHWTVLGPVEELSVVALARKFVKRKMRVREGPGGSIGMPNQVIELAPPELLPWKTLARTPTPE